MVGWNSHCVLKELKEDCIIMYPSKLPRRSELGHHEEMSPHSVAQSCSGLRGQRCSSWKDSTVTAPRAPLEPGSPPAPWKLRLEFACSFQGPIPVPCSPHPPASNRLQSPSSAYLNVTFTPNKSEAVITKFQKTHLRDSPSMEWMQGGKGADPFHGHACRAQACTRSPGSHRAF